jgi:microcystin-dependent protein
MAEPFLGELRLMSFNFAPKGWAMCNGQQLPINQNQALFSLLGTTFGGDGRVNFALPDLRTRVPIHVGNGHTLGERGGATAHTLMMSEMAIHTHTVVGATGSSSGADNPSGAFLGSASNVYAPPSSQTTTLNPGTIGPTGGSQPHTNVQPYLGLSFCIALQGIFPSPT